MKWTIFYFMVFCTKFLYAMRDLLILNEQGINTKTWIHNADITEHINWIDGKTTDDCHAFVFNETNTAPIFIRKNIATHELVLPIHGELILWGGSINFEEQSKCVRLKSINYYDWNDYHNWKGGDVNVATPHLERIPCDYDSIALPLDPRIRIHPHVPHLTFHSIKKGSQNLGNNGILYRIFLQSDLKDLIFYNPLDTVDIRLQLSGCTSEEGCLCHQEYVTCPEVMETELATCKNPIRPKGFCYDICGAAVTFKPKAHKFIFDKLKKNLKSKYTVSTHASRITDIFDDPAVQVVFAEDEFTGKSLEEAKQFYEMLKTKSDYAEDISLTSSGEYYQPNSSGVEATVGLVFGTLFAVLLVFVVIFYLYENLNLNLTRADLLFARFDTRRGNLIVETPSAIGSVISLAPPEQQRSFDNPMYGHSSSTTSIDEEAEEEVESIPTLHDINLINIDDTKHVEDLN